MIIYEEILREFQKQKIKYVLVGGMALNILGSLRNTADMDVLVEMSDQNLKKVIKILTKNGYKVKQPVDPMGMADKATRRDWVQNKHMKAFNFYKDQELKEVDIIIETPVSYEKARKTALTIKCGRLTLPVISVEHLITMKKKSNRPVDKLDIEDLKRIKMLRGRHK
ncbi:MAG: nucleotidyltransferase family protein [Candidatus Omnitrophica bacterium]|nr:nucleotidyltransferase family protein [Candidatus Omnitrophota bacterium]